MWIRRRTGGGGLFVPTLVFTFKEIICERNESHEKLWNKSDISIEIWLIYVSNQHSTTFHNNLSPQVGSLFSSKDSTKTRPVLTGFKIAVRSGLLPHFKEKLYIVCNCKYNPTTKYKKNNDLFKWSDFFLSIKHELLKRIQRYYKEHINMTEPWWLSGLMCQSIVNQCSRLRVQIQGHPFWN